MNIKSIRDGNRHAALGRSKEVVLPAAPYNAAGGAGPSISVAAFDGMKTTSTNPRNHASIIDKNGLAQPKVAFDAAGLAVDYRYEANGNLSQVIRTPKDNGLGQRLKRLRTRIFQTTA